MVNSKNLGPEDPTYIIAEMACAHEGEPELAHKLVDVAAKAKPNAIQLQLFDAEHLISPLSNNYSVFEKLEMPPSAWLEIISHAKESGLHIWGTIFDEKMLETFANDIDAIKLHSSDLSNTRLLDAVAEKNKLISLAVGGSTLDEIASALERLYKKGADDILLMHGYQGFPTLSVDSRLKYIHSLKQVFNCPVGYQDHTDGGSDLAIFLPLVAIGVGACVLEKHFTDDRSKKGTDFEASLDPDVFSRFVTMVRETDISIGNGAVQPFTKAEQIYRESMKKKLVASQKIKKGETITKDMLEFLRADEGIPINQIDSILGRRTTCDIDRFEPISKNMFV